jgi:hypothetical protein
MPNTLAHLGAQALVSRAIIRDAEHKWIYLGCVLPDVPWMTQRVLRASIPGLDPYDLRLYAIAQSSLVVSLVLAGALAAVSETTRRVLAILTLNCLLHLLLDALQTKWANGVHLFAPFSWHIWNAGLFWPESTPAYALSGFGLVYVAWAARRASVDSTGFATRSTRRAVLAGTLLLLYLALPLAFAPAVERSDSHSVKTLRDRPARVGREVAFDRVLYTQSKEGPLLRSFAGEGLKVLDADVQGSAQVSVRGLFVDSHTVRAHELHVHRPRLRDLATLLGLGLVATVWAASIRRSSSPGRRAAGTRRQ